MVDGANAKAQRDRSRPPSRAPEAVQAQVYQEELQISGQEGEEVAKWTASRMCSPLDDGTSPPTTTPQHAGRGQALCMSDTLNTLARRAVLGPCD